MAKALHDYTLSMDKVKAMQAVQDDIAKGRLVVPFKITLPADAGFYLVSPLARADSPKLSAFRQWLIASVQGSPAMN